MVGMNTVARTRHPRPAIRAYRQARAVLLLAGLALAAILVWVILSPPQTGGIDGRTGLALAILASSCVLAALLRAGARP